MHNLIPQPSFISPGDGTFALSVDTKIFVEEDPLKIGQYLAEQIGLSVSTEKSAGGIQLSLDGGSSLGLEGYELAIDRDSIRIRAHHPNGLFYGVQTLRQLLPTNLIGTINLPALSIRDLPRFEWRGAMLDVARHFFGVDDVKRYIDLISHYKMNRLHLHLTDDQGWRIEIKSWPRLTEVGSKSAVGGAPEGFYTQDEYKEIVEYAQNRFVMIIPEIDTPGHTNAALASYAELNQSEEATDLYEGTEVGFSTLWIDKEITYQFLNDVIGELAALTPAPYFHIGGDEARSTPEDQYKYFIKRVQGIVDSHNKIMIGWGEIGEAELLPNTIAQHWFGHSYQKANKQGAKIILSPANKTYLDMKYDSDSPLGLDWAGLVSVKDSYDWEPGSYMMELEEKDILGIEAAIWTETITTMKDIEVMAFPRLPGIAELAWSSKESLNWDGYKLRLAAHGQKMKAMGIAFFQSPDVPWEGEHETQTA